MKATAVSAYASLPQLPAARIVPQNGVATAIAQREAPAMHLTPRQLEVLSLLCEGLSNKLICRRLGIAAGTVKVHMSCIFRELGVNSRLQAAVCARRLGLVSDPLNNKDSEDSEPGTVLFMRSAGPPPPSAPGARRQG